MIKDDYEIISVESSVPPEPMSGTDWFCYVIGQGKNHIRGYKQGSFESVRESVEGIVTNLNERRLGKRGKVYLDMTNYATKVAGEKSNAKDQIHGHE